LLELASLLVEQLLLRFDPAEQGLQRCRK